MPDTETDEIFFPQNEDDVQKLNMYDKHDLEKEITLVECHATVRNMKNNTSPGTDGPTVEFYKKIRKDICIPLLRALNYAFQNGKLSAYQRLGIITCLPKPGKPKESL
jgi:hypothetical protein